MNSFFMNLSLFFNWVLEASFMTSILAIFIIVLKTVLKNKLSPSVHYILWLLILLRLMIPYMPHSQFSVYNVFSFERNNGFIGNMNNLDIIHVNNQISDKKVKETSINIPNRIGSQTSKINITKTSNSRITVYDLCFNIWLLGLFIFGIYLLGANIYVYIKINRNSTREDNSIVREIFEGCKKTIGLHKKIDVFQNGYLKSPVVMGIMHSQILLPTNIMNCINVDELKYIFLHELVHVKRKDLIINKIIGVLMILHWFNPIIIYSFRRMRLDRELACDSIVLSYLNEKEINDYGSTLIKLANNFHSIKGVSSVAGILNSRSQIKRRIIMIKSFKKNKHRWSVLGIAVIMMFSVLFLTNANNNVNALTNFSEPGRIIDKIDYPFITDNKVIGTWEYVDFVKNIKFFTPGEESWAGGIYLSALKFYNNGKMGVSTDNGSLKNVTYLKWTKGIVIHFGNKTASHYIIKSIKGNVYMFFEWKSGDYTIRHMKPYYYVLKKVK